MILILRNVHSQGAQNMIQVMIKWNNFERWEKVLLGTEGNTDSAWCEPNTADLDLLEKFSKVSWCQTARVWPSFSWLGQTKPKTTKVYTKSILGVTVVWGWVVIIVIGQRTATLSNAVKVSSGSIQYFVPLLCFHNTKRKKKHLESDAFGPREAPAAFFFKWICFDPFFALQMLPFYTFHIGLSLKISH